MAKPPPINIREACYRCREALGALSDIDIFLAANAVQLKGQEQETLFLRQNLTIGTGAVMSLRGALERIAGAWIVVE